jgi:cell division protein FtsX
MFFALSAAVCVNIFVSAAAKSRLSSELNKAVLSAQSITEAISAGAGDPQTLQTLFSAQKTQEGVYEIYYDKDWALTTAQNAVYTARIGLSQAGSMLTSNVALTKGETVLYTLESEFYTEAVR